MNAFAELCRFSDRQFYTDWWNSTSWSTYYRKWNVVVHDWLYAYVFQDSIAAGCSRNTAMLLTFAVSAIVHEYILCYTFGFFYPVLMIMFGCVGVFFIWLTKLYKGSRGWNIFMWFMLMVGQGSLLVLYSREWYARHADRFELHNGLKIKYDKSSLLPYSWQVFLSN